MFRVTAWWLAICFICCSGCAEAQNRLVVGGVHWNIPSAYVSAVSSPDNAPHSVTMQFALPGFTPVNPKDFDGVTPGDALPILSVTMTDDPKVLSGAALLKTLMGKVKTDCSYCVGDSILGGKDYSNYPDLWDPVGPNRSTTLGGAAGLDQYTKRVLTNGVPFKLYVNKVGGTTWFAVCYFPALVRMPCEVKEPFTSSITITYEFPMEYMAQALDLDAEIHALLYLFELHMVTRPPDVAAIVPPSAPCWSPLPNSPGAETVPLQVGPQLWHIPRAYAATFGGDQTHNPQVNGFEIYLKLPDLEPLGPNDPSPFQIHGYGRYIDIFFTYNDTALGTHFDLKMNSDGHFSIVPLQTTDEGRNPMIDYNELFTGSDLWDVSYNDNVTPSSFPPQSFICDYFSPGKNAGCKFYSDERTLLPVPGKPLAGYNVEYIYSREYFSQIVPISQCLQQLYERFVSEPSN